MFVFDPLAIALILMTNRMFELEKEKISQNGGVNTIQEVEVEPEPEIELEPENEPEIITPVQQSIKPKKEPVITTGKIELENIKEVKDRGYSVDVPQPKLNNMIQRIGTNKIIKDGNNDKVYFKRK